VAPVRRLVLDVLKPHEPSLVEFTRAVADLEGVTGVDASVVELDADVQTVLLTVLGESVDLGAVEATVQRQGGSVHSVDRVTRAHDGPVGWPDEPGRRGGGVHGPRREG
jgi:hypothetical protein